MRRIGTLALFLYAISIILGMLSLILSYTGISGGYDTEPLLAIAVLCLGIAGLTR